MQYRGAIEGKTGKTVVLPCKIERRGSVLQYYGGLSKVVLACPGAGAALVASAPAIISVRM